MTFTKDQAFFKSLFYPPFSGKVTILTCIFPDVFQPMVNCWLGSRWFGIKRVPYSNNPFHK